MLPGDKDVSMFLAFDGSVDADTAASFGLEQNFYETDDSAAAAATSAAEGGASAAAVAAPSGAVLVPAARPDKVPALDLVELSIEAAAAAVACKIGLGDVEIPCHRLSGSRRRWLSSCLLLSFHLSLLAC